MSIEDQTRDRPDDQYDEEQLRMGVAIEMEHTNDSEIAKKIAKDHLDEMPDYYTRLKAMERSAGELSGQQLPIKDFTKIGEDFLDPLSKLFAGGMDEKAGKILLAIDKSSGAVFRMIFEALAKVYGASRIEASIHAASPGLSGSESSNSNNYEVIVENVGSVYRGANKSEAHKIYNEYVVISKSKHGRAGGESVTLFLDGEIINEHYGGSESSNSNDLFTAVLGQPGEAWTGGYWSVKFNPTGILMRRLSESEAKREASEKNALFSNERARAHKFAGSEIGNYHADGTLMELHKILSVAEDPPGYKAGTLMALLDDGTHSVGDEAALSRQIEAVKDARHEGTVFGRDVRVGDWMRAVPVGETEAIEGTVVHGDTDKYGRQIYVVEYVKAGKTATVEIPQDRVKDWKPKGETPAEGKKWDFFDPFGNLVETHSMSQHQARARAMSMGWKYSVHDPDWFSPKLNGDISFTVFQNEKHPLTVSAKDWTIKDALQDMGYPMDISPEIIDHNLSGEAEHFLHKLGEHSGLDKVAVTALPDNPYVESNPEWWDTRNGQRALKESSYTEYLGKVTLGKVVGLGESLRASASQGHTAQDIEGNTLRVGDRIEAYHDLYYGFQGEEAWKQGMDIIKMGNILTIDRIAENNFVFVEGVPDHYGGFDGVNFEKVGGGSGRREDREGKIQTFTEGEFQKWVRAEGLTKDARPQTGIYKNGKRIGSYFERSGMIEVELYTGTAPKAQVHADAIRQRLLTLSRHAKSQTESFTVEEVSIAARDEGSWINWKHMVIDGKDTLMNSATGIGRDVQALVQMVRPEGASARCFSGKEVGKTNAEVEEKVMLFHLKHAMSDLDTASGILSPLLHTSQEASRMTLLRGLEHDLEMWVEHLGDYVRKLEE